MSTPLDTGSSSAAGPSDGVNVGATDGARPPSTWDTALRELDMRLRLAAEQGGAESVARQHSLGRLTIRERIAQLCDDGSFAEVGSLAGRGEYDEAGNLVGFTPSNLVFGQAAIDDRPVVVTGYDFTVRGGAADASVGAKRPYADRMAHDLRVPLVRLLEGAGGSVKSIESLGVSYVSEIVGWDWAVKNLSTIPVVAAALGPLAGLPAAEAPASHFSVMVKGAAQVFAAGPPLVEAANGERVTKEELGGWEVATRAGTIDNAVDTEEEAFEQIHGFLSYLPSHVWQLPPVTPSDDDPQRRDPWLRDAVPEGRRPIDTRRVMDAICDVGSVFEIGSRFGRSVVGALARIDGHPVAVLGTDARFDGAGFTTEASDKLVRFVDFADTFHLPVVYLVDNPGVIIGLAAERAGTLRAGCRALSAVHETRIPWASVLVRRCFGVGGATHRNEARHSLRVAWPSGSWGSLPLEGGVEAAYKRVIEAAPDPQQARAELHARLQAVRSPFRSAEAFLVEDIIDPADTRPVLCRWVRTAYHTLAADGAKPSGRTFRP
ncbi:MAG: biotin dependent acyl-CoA carboxylase [Ilumatobacteraceae bacterium]|nr:biotin dependent acyl-CoA carboxylase [Ilumatobacteraceae bacterium]